MRATDHDGDTPLCTALNALATRLQNKDDRDINRMAVYEEVVEVLLAVGAATDRCHRHAASLYRDAPKPDWQYKGEMLLLTLRRRIGSDP